MGLIVGFGGGFGLGVGIGGGLSLSFLLVVPLPPVFIVVSPSLNAFCIPSALPPPRTRSMYA